MKRSDVIRSIQVRFKHMRESDAAAIFDTVIDSIMATISNGNRVEIRGFGNFQPRRHAAKVGFNPVTRKTESMGPATTILFKPSPVLTKKMNE